MAEVAVVPQANGLLRNLSPSLHELAQYDKILSLRDDIFAGKHPRLKLNSQKLAQVSTVPGLNGPVQDLSPGLANANAVSQTSNNTAVQTNLSVSAPPSSSNVPSTHPSQTSRPTPSTSSARGFDPIFLTKSDDLISAEMKLERQRIERALEDEVQRQQRGGNRRRDNQDGLPDFDVSEVLEKAFELVKPLAASETVGAIGDGSAGSDSVDDNTFYSSQAHDSDPEDAELNPRVRGTKPCKYFFQGKCNRGQTCNFSHDPAFNEKLQQELTADIDMPDAYGGSHQRPASLDPLARRGSPDYGREEGELVESSYSPPHAKEPIEPTKPQRTRPNGPRNGRQHDLYSPPRDNSQAGRRRSGRGSPVYDNQPPPPGDRRFSGRASPNHDGKVVRNHITSPVAPQPARVSPLAVAKVPNIGRSTNAQEEKPKRNQKQNHAQESFHAVQQGKGKKRRREQEKNESRNVAPRRYIDSPGPYIKEEPISPPPLSAVPPSMYQHREALSSPLQHVSPQSERVIYRPIRERVYVDESPQRFERVSSPSARRVVSGPTGHYDTEPDLRRVVSARNLGRGLSPQEASYYAPSISAAPRPVSRAYVVDKSPEPAPSYRGSVQPQPVHYSRPQGTPEIRPLQYSPIQREITNMAPPPRRIVVDKYGREYYEAPVLREQYSERVGSAVPPPPRQRYVEDLDAPPASSRASMRPDVALQHPQETRYIHRISPEQISPRYTEPQVRYEYVPKYVEQYPPSHRVVHHAPTQAIGRPPASSHIELHQDFHHQPQIVDEQRRGHGNMPPPPHGLRVHSVAPAGPPYQQRSTTYADDYDEIPYQHPGRTRVATVQPEGGKYVYEGGNGMPRYMEIGGGEGGMRREPMRAGSVLVEGPRGRRIEYVERAPY